MGDSLDFFSLDWRETFLNYYDTRFDVWALNKENESCLIRIEDYLPYYYIELPDTTIRGKAIKWDITRAKLVASDVLSPFIRRSLNYSGNLLLEIINARTMFRYMEGDKYFVKIRCNKELVRKIQNFIRDGKSLFVDKDLGSIHLKLWETDITALRKFTMDISLNYADWFRVSNAISVVEEYRKLSTAKHEYIVSYKDISPSPPDESREWQVFPRMLAYDIEVYSHDSHLFPTANRINDFSFAISCIYQQIGKRETRKKYSILYGDCTDVPGADEVYRVETEEDLIRQFERIIAMLDVDVLCGHNTQGFDDEYLEKRLTNVLISNKPSWDGCGSRMKGIPPEFKDKSWSSNNSKNVTIKYIDFMGRISFDTYRIIKGDVTKRYVNYKLNTIAQKELGESKFDLSPSEMFEIVTNYAKRRERLHKSIKMYDSAGNPIPHDNVMPEVWDKLMEYYGNSLGEMEKIVDYCNKDSELVVNIFEKLDLWISSCSYANIFNMPIRQIYVFGQQKKVFMQLYAEIHNSGVIWDKIQQSSNNGQQTSNNKYKGAVNLGTILGRFGLFHNAITYDLSSMYPSIMIASNICTSTELTDEVIHDNGYIEGTDYDVHILDDDPSNTVTMRLIKPHHHVGFLPILAKKLLANRGVVKKLMAKEVEGSYMHRLYNSTQNALKVSANSIYGMIGSKINPIIPFRNGARLVTQQGRKTTLGMMEFINKGVPDVNDGKKCEVIYGDTDSIMFIPQDVINGKHLIELGYQYEGALNKYMNPLTGVFEKCGDILIESAKLYVYRMIDMKKTIKREGKNVENPNYGKFDYYKYSGVKPTRRDNCRLIVEIIKHIYSIVMDRDPEVIVNRTETEELSILQNIVDYLFISMHKILTMKYDISWYIMSKGYGKESNSNDIGRFAIRMKQMGQPIQLGERVQYALVTSAELKGVKNKDQKMRYISDILPTERLDVIEYVNQLAGCVDKMLGRIYQGENLAKCGALELFLKEKGLDYSNIKQSFGKLTDRVAENFTKIQPVKNVVYCLKHNLNEEYKQYVKMNVSDSAYKEIFSN